MKQYATQYVSRRVNNVTKEDSMIRKLLFATAATAAIAVAIPAASTTANADPYWDGGVGVQAGPFGFRAGPRHDYDRDWRGRHAYGYAYGCRMTRERIDTPSGHVIYQTRRTCD
jgi:hypothetical protein